MANHSWAVPVMRAGYAGRGATYLAVAGLSLWAIWRGGDAQGTESALTTLSSSAWGVAALWFIGAGLLAYAVWRGIDATADLERYGTEAKGLVARAGMVVTGLIHAALGASAIGLALGDRSGGGRGGVTEAVDWALNLPAGRWIVGFAALCTLGAAIYYVAKGIRAGHRKHLGANPFTLRVDGLLRAGIVAQGALVGIIGGFLLVAAWRGSENGAGGVGRAFDWLAAQPFGNVLVVALCVGLLMFAFFCFVNARYRIVPAVEGAGDVETLGARLSRAV